MERSYLGTIGHAVKTLCIGLKTTLVEYFTPKVTEQYPENRKTLHVAQRHRGRLIMPVDENGANKCIGCKLCEMACPNGTISITTKQIETEDGKKQRVLEDYVYDLGMCMFCELCVNACPHGAIQFINDFENAVFTREKLVQHLDKQPEDTKLIGTIGTGPEDGLVTD